MSLAEALARARLANAEGATGVRRALTGAGIEVSPVSRFPDEEGVYVGHADGRAEVVVHAADPTARQALIGAVSRALDGAGWQVRPHERHPAILYVTPAR